MKHSKNGTAVFFTGHSTASFFILPKSFGLIPFTLSRRFGSTFIDFFRDLTSTLYFSPLNGDLDTYCVLLLDKFIRYLLLLNRDGMLNPIEHIKVKPKMAVSTLLKEFGNGSFTARRLYEAYQILNMMSKNYGCLKFLTVAGAAVPGGLRFTLSTMIKARLFDVVIATGANLTHDLLEAFGERHFKGSAYIDDLELKKMSLSRIYDVYIKTESFLVLEKKLKEILENLPRKTMSSREFLSTLGSSISDENSILKSCNDMNVPIFCPTLNDSVLGLHISMYSRGSNFKVDLFQDQIELLDLIWNSEKTGALILGGGVPKNYLNQAIMTAGKPLTYVVSITTDRPEYGGLSGATPDEAISWGKVKPESYRVVVPCDFTIALPILAVALIENGRCNIA
jgi:deoxyhypusine synthase